MPEADTKPCLKQDFDTDVQSPKLKALLPVIEGLMRYEPGDRTSAETALNLLNAQLDMLNLQSNRRKLEKSRRSNHGRRRRRR